MWTFEFAYKSIKKAGEVENLSMWRNQIQGSKGRFKDWLQQSKKRQQQFHDGY